MQNLSKAIIDATQDTPGELELDVAANKWATFCLKTFKGKLLKNGLAISEAIANFMSELEHPDEDA